MVLKFEKLRNLLRNLNYFSCEEIPNLLDQAGDDYVDPDIDICILCLRKLYLHQCMAL